ncbi:MAG: GNAT family N-acetyltransferase [Beijerinckiaceae bacterium]
MQHGYFIRSIREEDYESLRALHTAAILAVDPAIYPEHIKQGWAYGLTAEGYGRAVADGELFDIACDASGQPVGFCGCKGDEIYGLFVHPDAQGHGVGAELLRQAESRLKSLGTKVSPLQATLCGVPFYRAKGWRFLRVEHVRSRGGPRMEIAMMEKQLG